MTLLLRRLSAGTLYGATKPHWVKLRQSIHNNSARDMHFICIDWTLWGLSTHIDQRVVICSDDGLSAGKTLFDTNLVSIVLLGIKFIEMFFEMQTFVWKK